MTTPLFGISGFKNSGKTTLTAKLIEALSAQGFKVSSIKHAHHEFDLDQPGTDTDQHRKAGAGEVLIASTKRWAIMHENAPQEDEPTLSMLAAKLAPCDIILAEGYKNEEHPKLLLVNDQKELDLLSNIHNVVAVAAEPALNIETNRLPRFDRNNIDAIAGFIINYFTLEKHHE